MPNKIYLKDFQNYRVLNDLKKLFKRMDNVFSSVSENDLENQINRTEIGSWFYDEARSYIYDFDSMEEDDIYDRTINSDGTFSSDELSSFQKERINKMKVDVEISKGAVKVIVHSLLKKYEFVSSCLSYNISKELETKINYLKDAGMNTYDVLSQKYRLTVNRYVKEGSSSTRVCDPSNIQVSNIINTVCRKFAIVDSFDSMIEYCVKTIYIDSKEKEKTEFLFESLSMEKKDESEAKRV